MKKTKKLRQKLFTLSLAALLPLTASTMLISTSSQNTANAVSINYQPGINNPVTLSNSNFNSNSSSTYLYNNLTGWTAQMQDGKTTAGTISVENHAFSDNYNRHYLVNNPGKSGPDNHILMINSKTKSTETFTNGKEGYRSGDIKLSENSYYSFQVSFKTDKNYEVEKDYIFWKQVGEGSTEEESDLSLSADTFSSVPFEDVEKNEPVYISFSRNSEYFFLQKALNKDTATPLTELVGTEIKSFYDDNVYVGFLKDDTTPLFVAKASLTEKEDESGTFIVNEGAVGYKCSGKYQEGTSSEMEWEIEYDSSSSKYKVSKGTPLFKQKDKYNPINAQTNGSIYLDGLTDENGDPIDASYVTVTSDEWVDFYFFVATGDKSQTVNLELWLGSKSVGSSGVVFFDNVNIAQYSENEFWKDYQKFYENSYLLKSSTGTSKQYCTSLYDLRKPEKHDTTYDDYNFDFEDGVYNSDTSSLKEWKKDSSTAGNARVFAVNDPEYFNTCTGYDFGGPSYDYDVEIVDENENGSLKTDVPRLKVVAHEENNYVLGLWTNNNSVKVTSKDVLIESKKIYKITAKYKVSSLDGNAYMFITENDSVVKEYNFSEGTYTLKEETASSTSLSNSDNIFINNYGTIEFYVKGGAYIDSSINISLGLGKADEASTGCIVFDDVKVELSTTEAYNNAKNKLELGETPSTSLTVPNGNFDIVNADENSSGIFTPADWTITSSDDFVFAGVVSADKNQYKKYNDLYNQNKAEGIKPVNNPYYWASFGKITNRFGAQEPDNILMLGNMKSSWQNVRSADLSISARTSYKLAFNYKTLGLGTDKATFKVTLTESNGIKIYESGMLSSQEWAEKAIYISGASGATTIHLEIDFGTQTDGVCGIGYFDNFTLTSGQSASGDNEDIVDLSNFFLNLSGEALSNTTTTPYKGSPTNSDGTEIKGEIVRGETLSKTYKVEGAEDEKFFYITIHGKGIYVIQSNFPIDLEADKYYDLSFKLKTHFNNKNILDSEKTYQYGVTFGLTGFEYMSELKSNDDYQTYHILFHPSEAKTTELYIAFVCDSAETAGSMALYDLNLDDTMTEEDFNRAKEKCESEGYDVNNDLTFVSSVTDEEETPDESTPDEDTTTTSNDFNWILVPTLITALAIIIAVVGYFLRKIKIKKIEIKRKESYDRKRSANVDFIKRKAAQERDAEIKEVTETKAKFEKELSNLETQHKQKVLELREKDKGKVSKQTDREFKLFARKRTVIAEKIDALEKQLVDIQSPEHLLSLEKKVYAEEQNKRKELEKASKEANKKSEQKDDKKEDV